MIFVHDLPPQNKVTLGWHNQKVEDTFQSINQYRGHYFIADIIQAYWQKMSDLLRILIFRYQDNASTIPTIWPQSMVENLPSKLHHRLSNSPPLFLVKESRRLVHTRNFMTIHRKHCILDLPLLDVGFNGHEGNSINL